MAKQRTLFESFSRSTSHHNMLSDEDVASKRQRMEVNDNTDNEVFDSQQVNNV